MRPTAPATDSVSRTRHRLSLILAAALAAGMLAGCSSGSGGDANIVRIAYNRSTDNKIRFKDAFLEDVKKQFKQAHPGKKVELVPIQAADNDYAAKVQQMMRSPKTAPDLVYEDTFRINSDIAAGYLRPLDDYLSQWDMWGQFVDTAKAAAKAQDGKTYGVPDGTDTRGLWYNKQIFAKAGLPAELAAEDLGRRPRRRPHDQAEGARRHPAQHLLGQGDGRGLRHAGLRDAALRHRRHRCTTTTRRSGSSAARASRTR